VVSLRRVYAPASAADGGGDPLKVGWRRGVPYESKLLLTNPRGEEVTVDAYAPLPNGALPLGASGRLRSERARLGGYETRVLRDLFYFPEEGAFALPAAYAASAAGGEALVGASEPLGAAVARELSQLDTTSWPEVARLGGDEQVLSYLGGANLHALDLSLCYNRLASRPFYERLAALLEGAGLRPREVWGYALRHRDLRRARELVELQAADRLGPYLRAGGLLIDARADRRHEHLDLDPLVPARAHVPDALPDDASGAATPALFEAHVAHLRYLLHKPRAAWDVVDQLELVYLLLKWGRVRAAVERFEALPPPVEGARLLYDYLDAYLSAYTLKIDHMRAVAKGYAGHPHPEWRARFAALLSDDDESLEVSASGAGGAGGEGGARPSAASLSLEVEGDALRVRHSGAREVTLSVYPVDIEALFSASPTTAEATAALAPLVAPAASWRAELGEGVEETLLPLPEEWRAGAALVEVSAGDLRATRAYTPHRFHLDAAQARGLLRLHADGAPLPGVYVKVYRQLSSGAVEIHKDGYTDHRGRFDYVSAHPSPALGEVGRFLILAHTRDRGARLLSVAPPAHR